MIADGVTLDASDGYTPEEKENPDERPTPIPVNPDGISEEPKSYPHWVCWRFEWKDDRGEWSKPPINPETGEYGKSNDPSTAASFQEALAYHERDDTDTDGLGFIVTRSPFAGVDGDAVHDPETGTFTDDGETLLEQIDAPIEISPSGRGIRALLIGDLPAGGRKGDPVEMYESGRYLTITGQRIPETADEIPPRDRGEDILADVHREFFPDDYADEDDAEDADDSLADVLDETDAAGDGIEDDDELIEKAKNAKNGDKFTRLWNGSSAGYPSDSEADMALCDMLAFWTGGDADQMDRLFRRSGLMREKWDDDCTAEGATYGEHTIAEAIDETDEYYDPNYTDDAESVDKTTIDGNTAWTYVRQQYADAGAKRGRSLATEALEDRTAWMHVLEEDRLWVYDHDRGIFHKWGEEIATGMLESGLGDEFSRSERNEIVARLEARNQVHREELNSGEHPEPLVCVGNGVVDLKTGELLDHDPSYRFTRGLKWDYDPENADPEPVRSFLDEITRRPEDRDTILDHLAHGIMPTHPYRAFVITYGEGANGKTQLQDLIEGFVGSENAAGVSLDALTGGDDFATGALPGAFVNIGDDEGTGEIRDTAMLKSLSGGGTRRANAKREKQFEFKNKAAMFFSANEPPRIAEEKPAINSRIYPIELPYQFKSDGEYDPENPLHKRKVPQIAKTR